MLEQLERHETREQVILPRLEVAPPAPVVVENDQRQRRRMVVALVLLLVALSLVLVKDREFWFPGSDVEDNQAVTDETPTGTESAAPAIASVPPTVSSPTIRKRERVAAPASSKPAAPEPVAPMVSANRAVLPPLRVEVVAGDRHQLVKPGSPSVAVDLRSAQVAAGNTEPSHAGTVVPAGDQVQMTTDARQALTRPVRPEYPLLARQMKVQGAVLLNALIGRDGGIQNLQVLSGPAILADAAREAVKQWRFKPYVQDGQAVETQAKITVNFEIRAH
jgi:TonB family protein